MFKATAAALTKTDFLRKLQKQNKNMLGKEFQVDFFSIICYKIIAAYIKVQNLQNIQKSHFSGKEITLKLSFLFS